MGFREMLFQKADVKSTTYNNSNERVSTIIASQISTRTEPTSRLVLSKDGRDTQVNTLFFFDYADITDIQPDYIITINGRNYTVIRADLLQDKQAPSHWEIYVR